MLISRGTYTLTHTSERCKESPAGPASPRGQLRTARAQVQHLRAKLLGLAGSQNESVARSDAGLRADLCAELQRAIAHLAVLEGGTADGAAATSGTARREGSGGAWRSGARSNGGSSGGSGTHAGSSADAGGSGDSSAAPRDATGHGTQPTQCAPDGEEEEEDDDTDALVGMALYGDGLEEEEDHEEEEEEEEEMLEDEDEVPSPPASDEEEGEADAMDVS